MEDQSTKICKMCCQQIDQQARKCPFCHHWQNKIATALSHPLTAVIPIMIPLMIIFLFIPFKMFNPGEKFSLHKDRVQIIQSKLEFVENKCGATLVVLGKIRNDGELSWEEPQFEAIFFDNNHKLFDTEQDEKYDFLIPPKIEIPFKLTFSRDFPEERYSSFEIKIIDAKEKDAF